MKKILILLATVCLCGCGMPKTDTPNKTNRDNGKSVIQHTKGCVGNLTIVEIKEHEYIVIGPTSNQRIIHAEHCACKNK